MFYDRPSHPEVTFEQAREAADLSRQLIPILRKAFEEYLADTYVSKGVESTLWNAVKSFGHIESSYIVRNLQTYRDILDNPMSWAHETVVVALK